MAVTDFDQPFYDNLRGQYDAGQLSPQAQQDFQTLDRAGQFDAFKPQDPSGAGQLTAAVNAAPKTIAMSPQTDPNAPTATNGMPQFQPVPPDANLPNAPIDQIQPVQLPDEMPRAFLESYGDRMGFPKLSPGSLYHPDSMEGLNERFESFMRSSPDTGTRLLRGLQVGGMTPFAAAGSGAESLSGSRELGNAVGTALPAAVIARLVGPRMLSIATRPVGAMIRTIAR